ncbi:hypothetical protein AAF712_009379 [Marasmius tenuissimus]|uniref:Uncharacterized protein n=1 Tax=Marasmius tenuissimus TaxID=585030 RepID=A0ABR2ZTP4_9AGAR
MHRSSAKSIQRARARLKLEGTRQRNASIEDLVPYITEIKRKDPHMGARTLVKRLRLHHNLKVPEKRVAECMKELEKGKVEQTKSADCSESSGVPVI